MSKQITVHTDVAAIEGEHLYIIKQVAVTVIAWDDAFTDQKEQKSEKQVRFIGVVELGQDKQQYLVTALAPSSQMHEVFTLENYRLFRDLSWSVMHNFSRYFATDGFDPRYRFVNSDGSPFKNEDQHVPMPPFVSISKEEFTYWVIRLTDHPEVGWVDSVEGSKPLDNTKPIDFYDHAPYAHIPAGSYTVEGPMSEEQAEKTVEELKEIYNPMRKSHWGSNRYRELVKGYTVPINSANNEWPLFDANHLKASQQAFVEAQAWDEEYRKRSVTAEELGLSRANPT